MGTRLKEHTATTPKAMVELAGKPLLQHAIEYLIKNDIDNITINVHHFANQIISFIEKKNSFGITINISDESEQLLDTGGGLKKAAPILAGNEPIVIYNVDVISNLDLKILYYYHQEQNAMATLVCKPRETSRYLMFDKQLQLVGWKNFSSGETRISREDSFADAKPLAFSGIHIIQPELLPLISEEGKFPIMDLYLRLAKTHSIKAFIDQSSLWMDLGKPEQLELAEKIFSKRRQ